MPDRKIGVLVVSPPLPPWQTVVMKVAVLVVDIRIAFSLNKRWWRAFWTAADAQEESHV